MKKDKEAAKRKKKAAKDLKRRRKGVVESLDEDDDDEDDEDAEDDDEEGYDWLDELMEELESGAAGDRFAVGGFVPTFEPGQLIILEPILQSAAGVAPGASVARSLTPRDSETGPRGSAVEGESGATYAQDPIQRGSGVAPQESAGTGPVSHERRDSGKRPLSDVLGLALGSA